MDNGDFKEIGRLKASNTTEVVVSELHRANKIAGYTVTRYIKSEEYEGWSKGVFVPLDRMVEFLKLFPKEMLEGALEEQK